MSSDRIDAILHFWFGDLDEIGMPQPEQFKKWWAKNPDFDRKIENLFLKDLGNADAGEYQTWLTQTRGQLAQILLFDQFPRNIFRDQEQMYAYDDKGLELSKAMVDSEAHLELPGICTTFALMPLMHSEKIEDQDRCVSEFEKLVAHYSKENKFERLTQEFSQNLKFAHQHRDIITRFERFPHRNEILGRESSAKEIEFLKQPGSSF